MIRYIILFVSTLTVFGCSGGGSGLSTTGTPSTNVAPVIRTPIADQTTRVGLDFTFDVSQSGTTFSDADNDTLQINITLPTDTFGLTATGTTISGQATNVGAVNVTVTASDPSGLTASDSFTINILAAEQQNILFIISDDIGKDSSAQYSLTSDVPTTPTLDSLASTGIVFENYWANPTCSPTRATLLTGKYGTRTNVLEPGDSLATSETILHEILANDGDTRNYATAIFGKWHLGGGNTGPNDAGVPHFEGIITGGVTDYFNWNIVVNGTQSNVTNYVTTELTDRAISWIGQQTEPWLVWMAYNAAHSPFHAPPSELHTRTLSGDPEDSRREHYLAAIEALDTEIGRLINSLDAQTRANTTILYVGDNGTPNGVRITSVYPKGAKGSVTEGGINVPMTVSGYGVANANEGSRNSELINGVDVFNTLLAMAGADNFTAHDGISFERFLAEVTTTQVHREYIFSETVDETAIRDFRYKLIENKTSGAQELYDLTNDPTEANNLLNGGQDVSAIVAALEQGQAALLD